MIGTLTRIARRVLGSGASVRSFDAASASRRNRGSGRMNSLPSAALNARGSIAAQARYLENNSPIARAAVAAWVSNVIASGIKAQSLAKSPKLRATISTGFEAWGERADITGRMDLYALQALAVHRMMIDGECFVLMINTPDGLRLKIVDAEQLDSGQSRELGGGRRIVQGIELDADGRPVAYYIHPQPLNLGISTPSVRIDTADVCHMMRLDHPFMVRGVSWFAPCLTRMRDLDEAQDAQLMRQKIGALLTGFVTDASGDGTAAAGFAADGEQAIDGTLIGGLEPGTLKILDAGKSITFSDPPEIGAEANEFMRMTHREIAAGLGLPFELLSGDLSQVNYSSIRSGLIEFRKRVEAVQYGIVVYQFLRRVFGRWVLTENLAGRLGRPGQSLNELMTVKWVTPRREWVDPQKDAEAEIAAINAGLMSRREAVASRGLDVEALDAEIASDHDREKALGLTFNAKPATEKEPPNG
jgi:lambda family phage portal protein